MTQDMRDAWAVLAVAYRPTVTWRMGKQMARATRTERDSVRAKRLRGLARYTAAYRRNSGK